jgi:hypothetical protein
MPDKNVAGGRVWPSAPNVTRQRLRDRWQKRQIDGGPIFDPANMENGGIPIDLFQFKIDDLGVAQAVSAEHQILCIVPKPDRVRAIDPFA